MRHIGGVIAKRRKAMGLSLSALSQAMGGSPGASFLSRIESGEVEPSPQATSRLAEALRLPREDFFNAAGFATPSQVSSAYERLDAMLGQDIPIIAAVPVLDADEPDLPPDRLPVRQRELKSQENVFLIDLRGRAHQPYEGEVMASRDRKPKEGQGVIARVDGRLGAYTWHTGKPTGTWIENGAGEKLTRFEQWGVILRVQPPALELE